jgi:ankyrin repeat protein
VELVRILLEYGANPDWCCRFCVTTLHRAIMKEYVDVVRLLLANGADVSIDHDGQISTVQLARRVGNKVIVEIIEQHDRAGTLKGDGKNGTNKEYESQNTADLRRDLHLRDSGG